MDDQTARCKRPPLNFSLTANITLVRHLERQGQCTPKPLSLPLLNLVLVLVTHFPHALSSRWIKLRSLGGGGRWTAPGVVNPAPFRRLIALPGDSRPRNSIHRREDKLHGPQCSSWGWGSGGERNAARGVGADGSIAVTTGNYGTNERYRRVLRHRHGVCVCVCGVVSWTGQRDSNRLQEIPCYSNSLNNYPVRLPSNDDDASYVSSSVSPS